MKKGAKKTSKKQIKKNRIQVVEEPRAESPVEQKEESSAEPVIEQKSEEPNKAEKVPAPDLPAPNEERQAGLDALRKAVQEAQTWVETAKQEAAGYEEKARTLIADAKRSFQEALIPYREACRRAKIGTIKRRTPVLCW